MKHSIRTKITLMLTTLVIITIIITWFINSAFLEVFYMERKEDKLYEAYTEVAQIFQEIGGYELSEEDVNKVEMLETKYDVDLYVISPDMEFIFPESKNIGERDKKRAEEMLMDILGMSNPFNINKKFRVKKSEYLISTYYDKQMASTFIDLRGKIEIPSTDNSSAITGAAENITGTPQDITGTPDNNKTSELTPSIDNSEASTSGTGKDNSTGSSNEITGAVPEDNSTSATDEGKVSEESSAGSDKSGDASVGTDNKSSDSGVNGQPNNNLDNKDHFKKLKDNQVIIYLRSNTGSITESVKIANEFLAYVGIIAAIIGSIAMFIITKRFTKPILDLSKIAQKMSDLNFDVKYNVDTKDEIGELGSCINTLSDKLEATIMELKQANNELMTDIQRKTEIDEMRKEFLSNVSHELKTPIALIQGYAEGLKENINEDEESRDYYCEVIMDEANKMNNMVKKLLSLNELEFGNNQVNYDRFDIVNLINSVLSSTDILFKQKEVTLHFEQPEPVYVWADEFLIEQILTNYISNALNHVSGQKIIEIKLIPRGDTIRIAVFNTGNVIPEDELNKVWIKFYKVDKARTREYGGSGIGLSIVKAIMNSHNKECGVINRQIGVEFWFELDTKKGI